MNKTLIFGPKTQLSQFEAMELDKVAKDKTTNI